MSRLTKQQRRAKRKRKKAEYAKRHKLRMTRLAQRPQPWVPPKMKMFRMPDIFPPEASKEERIAIIRSVGSKAREDFDKKYPNIEKWFAEHDPLYLLSFCAFYFVSQKEGIDPEATGELDFPHHYLEIMQAFALCQERNYSAKPLLQNTETLKKEMEEIGKLMSLRLLDIPPEISTDEALHAYRLRTEMMASTTGVRNWAYFHQMKRVVLDLAKPISNEFHSIYKIGCLSFFKLIFALTEERDVRLSEHQQKLRSCIKEHNYREMVKAYNQFFPDTEEIEGENIDRLWELAGEKRRNLIGLLISHSDLRLEDVFSFSLEDAKSLLEETVSDDILEGILDKLSLNFGDLKSFNKDYIILGNPVLEKPFIKLDGGRYYSAIWGIMPHLAFSILEDLVWQDEGLREKYTRIKARYLEDEIHRLFSSAFPNGSTYRGSLWHDPVSGKDYENDLIEIIDSFAIVIEAKSGTIDDPAMRGAPNRLFETLRKLIEEPSDQALRFINLLEKNKGPHTFQSKYGGTNTFDTAPIKYYIPLGVTLSNIGMISSNLKKLISAKVVNKTIFELAPSINVTDLECVFELLPLESEKIHYLARRREFEAHLDYDGDELDLLGFYLDNGFNIGEDEYSKGLVIHMSLKSKELDPYFVGKNEGLSIERPQLAMTKWWRDLLVGISSRREAGWIESCFVLLNTTKQDQEKFELEFSKLKSRILKGDVEKKHNWILFISGPERRRYVIAGYPYLHTDRVERNGIMSQILDEERIQKARGAVIIGVDIERNDYPYSVFAQRLSTDLFDTLP
jgi:hypothetical protein